MLLIYTESFVKPLFPAYLDEYYIHIPKKKIHLFPEPPSEIQVEYGHSSFPAWVKSDSRGGAYIGNGLSEWFKAYRPELEKVGKIIITVDRQNRRCRLEIPKK